MGKYDEEYKIWRDKTENTEYMKNIVKGEFKWNQRKRDLKELLKLELTK